MQQARKVLRDDRSESLRRTRSKDKGLRVTECQGLVNRGWYSLSLQLEEGGAIDTEEALSPTWMQSVRTDRVLPGQRSNLLGSGHGCQYYLST